MPSNGLTGGGLGAAMYGGSLGNKAVIHATAPCNPTDLSDPVNKVCMGVLMPDEGKTCDRIDNTMDMDDDEDMMPMPPMYEPTTMAECEGFLAEPKENPCPDKLGSDLKDCMEEYEEEQEE